MFKINENYKNLKESYLFTDIARKVREFCEANPDHKVIRMGIGDVTEPLIPEVVEAMKRASGEMGVKETFRGYGPEQGYAFLREKIAEYYHFDSCRLVFLHEAMDHFHRRARRHFT